MNALSYTIKGIKRDQKSTMKKIDARKQKHDSVAKELGFRNAQEAFNTMGKDFLDIANNY